MGVTKSDKTMQKFDKELADLKKALYEKYGTEKVKVSKKLGPSDPWAGGTPRLTAIRAVSETEFEWYLDFWDFGWKKDTDTERFPVDKQKSVLRKLLGIKLKKLKVTLPTEMVQNIIKYCEDKQVYDKLGAYGDFYYKLKRMVDKR